MSLAHLTLPTLAVERTARFLEQTLGYTRDPAPANSPVETVWLAAGVLKERLLAAGAHLMQPVRPGVHERFFFREPVSGYVFEVIAQP